MWAEWHHWKSVSLILHKLITGCLKATINKTHNYRNRWYYPPLHMFIINMWFPLLKSNVFLVLGKLGLQTGRSMWSSKCLIKGDNHFSPGYAPFKSKMLLAIAAARACCWLRLSPLPKRTHGVFPAELLPSQPAPSLYCRERFLQICRSLHLFWLNFHKVPLGLFLQTKSLQMAAPTSSGFKWFPPTNLVSSAKFKNKPSVTSSRSLRTKGVLGYILWYLTCYLPPGGTQPAHQTIEAQTSNHFFVQLVGRPCRP